MSQETIRVLLVDDIADTRENMKKLLFFEDDIEVVGTAGNGEEGIELAKTKRPDVVVMDINMPGIDGISAAEILTKEVPGIQIIMMSVQGEADYLRRSMLAGAREFLIKPPSAEEIVTSIRRVYSFSTVQQQTGPAEAEVQVAPQPAANTAAPAQVNGSGGRKGEIIAVFGTKGGVGTSSVTVNLAIALREQEPEARVAVVDGNTEFGDLSVLFNLNSERTIMDLIGVEDLEPEFVYDIFVSHPSGVKVMPGSSPPEAELVTGDQVSRVAGALCNQFDYILFDTRPTFLEPVLTILDLAETIILLSTADIPSIRNARLFFDIARELEYPKDKVKLVLNKYDPQGGVSSQAIQGSIKHPISAELPRDDRVANNAIQQGLPYMIGSPRCPLSLATTSLARKLLGKEETVAVAKQPAPQRQKKAQPTKKTSVKKRSLFSKLFGR